MYKKYFGLKETPFSIAPDPRYLYMSGQHREALAHLLYGVNSDGGFVLLTGEVGTGKTTVCRCLLEQMPANCDVAFIFNPKLTVKELLSTICDELRIKYPQGTGSIKVFIDLINAYLLDAHAKGRKAVLIIDEAQRLSLEVLEQIRLLTNLETNQRKLLQVILLGQPELKTMLARPNLKQLSQRIIARYHLGPLSRMEVGSYVSHRLSIAGLNGQVFPDSTLAELYRLSGGIPRLINVLCDRALLGTYAQGRRSVNKWTMRRAAREVFGEIGRRSRVGDRAYVLVLAALIVIGTSLLLLVNHTKLGKEPVVPESAAVANRESEAAMVYRRPIPTEVKQTTSEPQISKAENHDLVPWALLDRASVADSSPPSAIPASPSSEVASTDPNPASVPEPTPDPAPLTLYEKFTEEARLRSTVMADQALFKLWGVTYQPDSSDSACQQAEAKGLRCLEGKGDLNELRKLNLPAVLKLVGPQGQSFHVTLKVLQRETATLALGSEAVPAALEELTSIWKGQYTLLWRPPPQYQGNLREGDGGPAVKWLESRLRRVQGKAVPLRKDPVLDAVLVERVKRYQLSKGLKPDGLVGPRTLILLGTDGSSKMPLLTKKN
jgi:general secretion pathway protein A